MKTKLIASLNAGYTACLNYWAKLNRKQKALFISGVCSIPIFMVLILYLLVGFNVFNNIPKDTQLRNINNPIASELYASEGKLIGRYFIENRSHLKVEDLNDIYKNALIATEDHRYYEHAGVDYQSLLRVLIKSMLLRRDASGGGSTITQQLAKNLFPRKKHKFFSTIINKFREMHIARSLEDIYTKEEILWLYSNTVSFGERAFGLATASHRFFNKEPKDLLIEEAATLVGLLKGTTYYSPRKNPERARFRRDIVLSQMAKYGYINENAKNTLINKPLKLDYQSQDEEVGLARYFHQHVIREFSELSESLRRPDGSAYNLFYDGLKVYTSLNYDMQVSAEKIVVNYMTKLQKIFEDSWQDGNMYGNGNEVIDQNIVGHPSYQSLKKNGLSGKEALSKFNIEEEIDFWSWSGESTKKSTRIDSIKYYLKLLHTGLLAADPKSGEIKVWVGGNDYRKFQYDNITEARQVGSLFKPIVYLTALEQGKSACDFYQNELRTYRDYKDWTPKNSNEEYGGYLSMNSALTHSVNTVSVQVLFDAGIDNVVKSARNLGISAKLSEVPSIVLGTSDVSLFEMVQAYSNITNGGQEKSLKSIMRIEDRAGNVIYEAKDEVESTESLFKNENIDAIKSMMTSVARNGTASRLYQLFDIPFPVFGKTGTTQKQSDGWFIGCTEDLVIGSWVGTKDRRMHFRNIGTGSGGRTALPMVGALFEYAGQRGYIKSKSGPLPEFNCPDMLDDEQYAFYQNNKDIFEDSETTEDAENDYGGWLSNIFRKGNDNRPKIRKGTLNQQYEENQIKKELEKLKQERDLRMQQYEQELREWESRLEKLRKNQ